MTPEEREAFDSGFLMGQIHERARMNERSDMVRPMGVTEVEHRHLRLVPVDAPTAQLIEFPTTEKTAS